MHGYFVRRSTEGVYLGVRTCEIFLCFVPFIFLGFIVLTSLFSLFYVTGVFSHRVLHRGWADRSGSVVRWSWLWLSQFQACPSPPPPPPGICHFVVEKPQCPTVGRLVYAKTPWWGFKKVCKCPNLLKTTPKLHFPVSELQVPYLQEICNNLIKMH